jgi:CRP-like cAMP-binding protein
MFPKLRPEEIERLRQFGEVRRYKAGDLLLMTGEPSPGMFVIIVGTVAVSSRDGLGHVVPIVEEGPGQFLAEIGQLSGRPALVDARAKIDIEALLIQPEGLRRLIIAEAELGEKIMRALILRRVALIENGAGGPVLIGPALNPDLVRLQNFLARNGYPHQVLDPDEDVDARALVERVFLSGFAAKISMLVRADSLALSMSRYLIERIEARPNIELLFRTEIVALTGTPEGRLERVRWRDASAGVETERAIRNVFLFIGADPATNWLRACGVGLDAKGFVLTGPQAGVGDGATTGTHRPPLPLESNVPGVFAVGDARLGSVKRVGGAIGEGAAVVAQLHSYLAASRLQ